MRPSGGGEGGGGKRSNHDEMADRGWGPVCTERPDRWKREAGRTKKGGLLSDPEWLRDIVYPCPPSHVLALTLRPSRFYPVPPVSLPPALRALSWY